MKCMPLGRVNSVTRLANSWRFWAGREAARAKGRRKAIFSFTVGFLLYILAGGWVWGVRCRWFVYSKKRTQFVICWTDAVVDGESDSAFERTKPIFWRRWLGCVAWQNEPNFLLIHMALLVRCLW